MYLSSRIVYNSDVVSNSVQDIGGKIMGARTLGRYIVADPDICHGQPVFRGTRILVADVLEQIASDMVWEAIIEEWRGALNKEAIAEAVKLAREALVSHAPELAVAGS